MWYRKRLAKSEATAFDMIRVAWGWIAALATLTISLGYDIGVSSGVLL